MMNFKKAGYIIVLLFFTVSVIRSQTVLNVSVKDINGNITTIENQASGKIIVLDFWATWCKPCVKSIPELVELSIKYSESGVSFVGVGIDTWDGNSQQVSNFKASTGLSYTMLLSGSGVVSNFLSTYDRIIVVDKEGVIKFKSSGFATKQTSSEAKAVIESLLGNIIGKTEILVDDGSLGLYPNPVYSFISINNPFAENESIYIDIIDVTGRVLITSEFMSQGSRLQIPLGNIPEGYYMFRLRNKYGDMRLARIIKKN